MTGPTIPNLSPKDLFIRDMRQAPTLEDLISMMRRRSIEVQEGDVLEACIGFQKAFMRQRIEQIKTPEDVLEVHNYFKNLGLYSKEIQRELGLMASQVIGKWTPDSTAFNGASSGTK